MGRKKNIKKKKPEGEKKTRNEKRKREEKNTWKKLNAENEKTEMSMYQSQFSMHYYTRQTNTSA